MKRRITIILAVILMQTATSTTLKAQAPSGFKATAAAVYTVSSTSEMSAGPDVTFRYFLPLDKGENCALAAALTAGIRVPLSANPIIHETGISIGLDTGWETIRIMPYITERIAISEADETRLTTDIGCETRIGLSKKVAISFGAYARPQKTKTEKNMLYAAYIGMSLNLENKKSK